MLPGTISFTLLTLCLTKKSLCLLYKKENCDQEEFKRKLITQQSKDFKKELLTMGLRKHTATLSPKLVSGTGREVWQGLATMAQMLFFLGSQEDHSSQPFLKAGESICLGSGQQNVHENVHPFLQAWNKLLLSLLLCFLSSWLTECRGPSGGLWRGPFQWQNYKIESIGSLNDHARDFPLNS